MFKSIVAAGALAIVVASLAHVPAANATHCTLIRASGIGLTDGIARWMATQAVTDSANKWAAGAKYKLSPAKISCTGLNCKGEAKACKS